MTTQHTPGPWRLSSGDETEIFSGARPVARAHCGGLTSVKLPEAEANARLIAAAPELLDTLERFVTACHAHLPESTDQAFCGLYASARVAIAKATATP